MSKVLLRDHGGFIDEYGLEYSDGGRREKAM